MKVREAHAPTVACQMLSKRPLRGDDDLLEAATPETYLAVSWHNLPPSRT